MDKKQPNPTELNVELTEDIAEGIYSNFSIISHSQSEFVIDFLRIVPNMNKAKVKSRIMMTPQQAKRLVAALRENIKVYENQHGLIKEDNNPVLPSQYFNPPKGQA
jgi:Protein of unknown function (DUF3467)